MKLRSSNKKMDDKHISNKKKRLLNKCSQPNVSNAKINAYFTEQNFDNFLKNIKAENYSPYHDESNDLGDSSSIACKIVSMNTSSPSTALPIMKISSLKSEPHTCLEYCFKCNHVFRVLDSPFHIRRIRSIKKKNEFLKIDPLLCVDSCLCDYCWKDLNKSYRSIKSKNIKEETNSEKKSRLLEHCAKKNVSKNQNQAKRCSINECSQSYYQKMSVNESENIKRLFLTFESCHLVFVPSIKQTTDFLKCTFCFCKMHNAMISVMSTCQICGDKLNAPFNTEDWLMYKIWNFVLIENNLSLILKPGMFICVTCKGHISKINPGFPTIDLPRLREYILKSNSIRLKLYGESHNNLFNKCKGSTYLAPPIVVDNIKEEKECVHSTRINFSDALKDLKEEVLSFEKFEEYLWKYEKKIQNLCQVDNVKIYKNESGIIGSHPVFSEHIAIENKQSKLNPHAICSVDQDRSNMNLKEGIQCMNETNTIHKNIYLNETDNSMYSFAVDPPNTNNSHVPIKRKQSNIIFDTISNKDVKQQRLNEKYNYYENNSTEDNTTKSYRNKIIDHPCINSPSILNMNSNCKNKYDSNSDISHSVMFSETDSEEILLDCEKKETDNIIIDSDDDLSLDSNCEFIKSKFNIKPHHEIEMDKNYAKSITSTALLNVAQQNLYTSKLELNDEKLDIVNLEEEYFKRHDNSLQNLCQVDNVEIVEKESGIISSHQVHSEHNEIENNHNKLTDYIIVDSTVDLCLDSNCELINTKFEIKPNHEIEKDCEIVSDTEKSIDTKIISNGENVLENYKINLDGVNESNSEMVPVAETESDSNEQSHINISVTEEVSKKLSTFKIVSNIQKGLDHEILLDGDKVIETASWSEKGTIKYKIIFDDEIKPSGNQGSTCIIISDNDEEFNNRVFSTYKVNVQKGSDSKIILDGEKVKILSESENRNSKYEINPSANKKSICIIIFDNKNEFIHKNLSTYKIVSKVEKELECEMLLNAEKVYDIESDSENGKIQYMIVSKNKIKSSDNKGGSQCTIISDNEEKFNHRKSTFKMLVKNVQKESHSAFMDGEKSHKTLSENENERIKCMIPFDNEEEFNYKKVSDITIMSNSNILVDDSQGLNPLDLINSN